MRVRFKELGQQKLILWALLLFFVAFLAAPLIKIFACSFRSDSGTDLMNYTTLLTDSSFLTALGNSFKIAGLNALLTTLVAFFMAFALNNTNISLRVRRVLEVLLTLPMLLPTITYGFAIIYTLGKQGLLTRLIGFQLFDIYGFNGLLFGYFIYALPPTFLIINNAFKYVDRKYIVVSKLMGDPPLRTLKNAIIMPTILGIANAFIISFVLTFTDFGLPASIAGDYDVIATRLYQTMLGSIPDLNGGATVAVFMLIPAALALGLQGLLARHQFYYDSCSQMAPQPNRLRDGLCLTGVGLVIALILLNFAVIFIIPFVKMYPYDMSFTWSHFTGCFQHKLLLPYLNSLKLAALTAVIGTVFAYVAALLSERYNIGRANKALLNGTAMVTHAIPGMVLGLGYLLVFTHTPLKGTLFILVACNVVHFFCSPYLMARGALSKISPRMEETGKLMGDHWVKSLVCIIIPSTSGTLIEMFSYYFINSMVTISAIIFLVNARTAVLTTKIKELQHFAKFDQIFVLSALLFLTNIAFKIIASITLNRINRRTKNEH